MVVNKEKVSVNEVYNEDSIEFIKNMDSDSIHLILSDIPYGIGVEDWDVNNSNEPESWEHKPLTSAIEQHH